MKPLFSLKFTVFLILVLLVPFVLKTVSRKLEPYPAIILPSGASKLDLKEGKIGVDGISIYGYDTQGNLEKIDVKQFIAPIPSHYFHVLANNEFGLSTKTTDEIWLRGLNKKIDIKRKSTSSEHQELAKIWLANRLKKLGLSTSSILIRYEFKELSINDGKELSRKITNEKNISLH